MRLATGLCCASVLLSAVPLGALAQAPAAEPGIYTCVDKTGRKLTADRPIVECLDRTQNVLGPSGTVKRQIGPSLTAQERQAQEEKERAVAQEQARAQEEKRRERALLARYPNANAHQQVRSSALTQVDQVITAARQRLQELVQQRRVVDQELEFYKKDPARAPAPLRRELEDNEHSQSVQKRFIADQESEKERINRRFDEQLTTLQRLWAQRSADATNATSAAKK